MTPPRRGAPLGNRNALKHGFYSRHFHKADLQELEKLDPKGLIDEIGLLRLHVRRLTEYSLAVTDLNEYIGVLRTINLLTSTIYRLIKTQVFLAREAPGLQDAFDQALDEIAGEWAIPSDESVNEREQTLKDFIKYTIRKDAGQAQDSTSAEATEYE